MFDTQSSASGWMSAPSKKSSCPGSLSALERYACRKVKIGSSGLQVKRTGRMLVPVPRLT